MNPSRKLKSAIGLLSLMLASAACALAQAEINPDHFPDPAQPEVTAKKTAVPLPGTKIAAVKGSPLAAKQETASHTGSTAAASTQASAANHNRHTSSNHGRVAQHASDRSRKKLVSEVHHYAAP